MTISLATDADLARMDKQNAERDHKVHALEQSNAALQPLLEQILAITTRIEANMATQADVDALTASVTQIATDLEADFASIQAELDRLATTGVDVSALQAAVAPLDDKVKALGALQPTPPPTP